ncbi:unnamed protein product [Linum tenue]|uniref:TF-B3 domain-containing protein n=1 Tax=Linum tenue TaxID=586396 RepID=A0AAV0GVE6_9ROSI|nr:unnamed protein product [Linum tenue]
MATIIKTKSIPVAFSERFFDGGEMAGETAAVLRTPGGKSYQVKISGGREFSDAGWKAFAADHSLHVGDFVVFRYDARMVFDVMIFDPSACERVYPSSSPSSSLPFLVPVKPERETIPVDDDEQPETELDSRTTDESGDDKVQETSTVKAAARSVPKGPFFVVNIGRNTLKKNRLPIPKEFTMKNNLESRRLAMVLNEEGNSWPAHLIITNRLAYPKYRPQVVLGRGIGQFLEDNGLQLGDTFYLELVQGGENPVFRMSGLHSDPEAMKRELEKVRKKIKLTEVKEEQIPSGSSTAMQNHFLIKLTNRYFDGYALHIPKEFALNNGLIGLKCVMILRNEEGSPYPVKLRSSKAGRPFIGTGWYDLVRANRLRMGDVLRFELVETGMNPVMTFKSMPEAFYKNYFNGGKKKRGADQAVVLRTRRGKFHAVRVSGRAFKDGWKEFVEEHDLHVGDFLVFRLDGEMEFHVMVFDPTVCERRYQQVSSVSAKQNQIPAAAGNVFVEIEVEETQIPAVEETKDDGFHFRTPREENIGDKASIGAEKAGSGFPNSPFFEFTAGTNTLSNHRYIPIKFARENGLAGKSFETIVMDEEGRPWPARYLSYPNATNLVHMGDRWREFQKKNGLEMGDSLKFELVQGSMKPVFRMSAFDLFPIGIVEGFGMRRMEKEVKMELVHEGSIAAAPAVSSRDNVNTEVVQEVLNPAYIVSDPKDTDEILKVKQEPVHEESASSKDGSSYPTINLPGAFDFSPLNLPKGFGMRRMEKDINKEPVLEELPAAAGVSSSDSVDVEVVQDGQKPAFKLPDPIHKMYTKIMEKEVKEPVHKESAAAESSKDGNSYFTVKLTEGYLKGGFLNLPQEFAIKNGLHGISVSMLLANAAGAPFLVSLKTTQAGRPYIGSGWRDVVASNQLRMGDVVRFELVESGSNPVMNFKSIPVGFGKYLEGREVDEENAVLRSPGGRIYRVKMGKGREFKDGWKEFVHDHNLHVGDVMVFRLVDAPMVFDVLVFDSSACEKPYFPPKVDVKTEEVQEEAEEKRPLPVAADVPEPASGLHNGTPMEKIAVGKDGPSEPKKPYFVVSIQPDNLKRGRLHLPGYFAKMNGLNVTNTEAVVLNEEGRSWPVRINCYRKPYFTAYIMRGWRVFQMENELKLGDTFSLELVQGGQKPVLQMSGLHQNRMLEKVYREKVGKESRKIVEEVKTEPDYDQDSPAAGFSKTADAHFMLTVSSRFLGGICLRIPEELARYSGLYGRSRTLVLRNENGGDWQVMVNTSTNGITYIASGWTQLVKENGLSIGDSLRVQLLERGMNPVTTFKSIPVGFDNKYLKVREVGEEDAVLRSPGGEIYRVKMGKGREFEDGWKEFVDDHDLHVGDVVVFRLVDAPMVFDVMIFDPNACERPYRRQQLDAKTEEVQEEEEEKKPLPCAADVPEPETGLHSRSVDNISGTSREKIVKDGPSEAKKPYFVVSIKLDSLKRGRVIVPKSFSKMNGLDAAHTTDAVVLDEEGRSWPVGINYYGNSTRTTYIERGWRVIQKEYELKLGDTFNLELVQGGQKLALRMSGLHANPMLEREYRDKARKEKRKNVKDVKTEPFRDQDSPAAGFSKMSDSHFMLTITNQFLRGISLRIPDDLARYSGLYGGSRTLILTNEKGGDWLVTVETSSNNITYIASGWTELVKENGLHVGDTLRVDLVERGMNPAMTFKFSRKILVIPKVKNKNMPLELDNFICVEGVETRAKEAFSAQKKLASSKTCSNFHQQ